MVKAKIDVLGKEPIDFLDLLALDVIYESYLRPLVRIKLDEKIVNRPTRNSINHHFPQMNIAKLTCQVKIESQFYLSG
jgi:hypothetical protein